MISNGFKLGGWLLFALAGMAIGWPFFVVGLVLEHTSGVNEFFSVMLPLVAGFGSIAMVGFLLGKSCFWLSQRFAKTVSEASPRELERPHVS